MMLFWKIGYLDCSDKHFKDRHLYLDTRTLDPVIRAAVELVADGDSHKRSREIMKYRHLFTEASLEGLPNDFHNWGKFASVGPREYFEDETGKELSEDQMAQILTGSPTARSIPRGAKQHDIDFMLSTPKPVPLAEVSLSPDEIRVLGYFVRDLEELRKSAFLKDGPGTLKYFGNKEPTLETAVTHDEIKSFMMTFRRLYMSKKHDEANFLDTVPIFMKALGDHPYAKWVDGVRKEYQDDLAVVPETRPFCLRAPAFTTKRLLDVFTYTRFAHQPDQTKERQFKECLAEAQGKQALLTWLFFVEISRLSSYIVRAGKIISWWFSEYCKHHGVTPTVLKSLLDDHPGLGAAEKEEVRRERLFEEKAEQLATELWEQAGRPAGGSMQFLASAREQLAERMKG